VLSNIDEILPSSMWAFLQDSMLKKDLKHILVELGTNSMRYFCRFKLATMFDAADCSRRLV